VSIIIEKRTRATIDDQWSNWSETTDTPPYNNTDLIEYRVANNIDIDDLTNGTIGYDSNNAEYKWVGTGIFDTLVNAVVGNIKIEYDSGRIAGAEYANVYLGSLQTVINTAATLWMQQPETEAKIDLIKEQITASQAETEREDSLTEAKINQINEQIVYSKAETNREDSVANAKINQINEQIAYSQAEADRENSLAVAKNAVSAEQKELLKKQQALVERQTKGFDDNAKQKVLKQLMDSWSVAYSVAQDANGIPDSIKVDVVDSVTKDLCDKLGISIKTNPIGI